MSPRIHLEELAHRLTLLINACVTADVSTYLHCTGSKSLFECLDESCFHNKYNRTDYPAKRIFNVFIDACAHVESTTCLVLFLQLSYTAASADCRTPNVRGLRERHKKIDSMKNRLSESCM